MLDFFKNIGSDTSDYVKTRFTNPFLLTLLGVWIIRNFDFIYAFFNFAEGVTLTQRIYYFHRYFNSKNLFFELLINVLWTTLILILSYLLLLGSRWLTNQYTKALNELNKKTARGSVVSKEEHESLEEHLNTVKTEKDQLKTEARLHDDQIKMKDSIIVKLTDENQSLVNKNEESHDLNEKFRYEISKIKSDNDKLVKEIKTISNNLEISEHNYQSIREQFDNMYSLLNKIQRSQNVSNTDIYSAIFLKFIKPIESIEFKIILKEEFEKIHKLNQEIIYSLLIELIEKKEAAYFLEISRNYLNSPLEKNEMNSNYIKLFSQKRLLSEQTIALNSPDGSYAYNIELSYIGQVIFNVLEKLLNYNDLNDNDKNN